MPSGSGSIITKIYIIAIKIDLQSHKSCEKIKFHSNINIVQPQIQFFVVPQK